MRVQFWKRADPAEPGAGSLAAVEDGPTAGNEKRHLLKVLAASVAGVGLGAIASEPEIAGATYTNSSGTGVPDSTTTDLQVNGNLTIMPNTPPTGGPGRVGIGTTSPAGVLDVAGEIHVTTGSVSTVVIGSDGVVKQSYYAP